ncbi:MAG: TrkA family potassium uptake protein [Methanotrichaceae archaeon]
MGVQRLRKNVELILAIILMIAVYGLIFMTLMDYESQTQNINPITALYWVMTTITTLGYGDIVFRSEIGRFFTMIVAVSGIVIFWAVILPMGLTPRFERLVKAKPNSAPEKIEDHIIISGYSPMVEILAERLALLKIPFIIIERSENVARSIFNEYPTLCGDPSEADVLLNGGINSAKLFIANEKEELNADVILAARSISDIKIIALVDGHVQSRFLDYAGASRTVSPKSLLGKFLAQITVPPAKNVFPGAIKIFEDLILVELPIYPGCKLIKQRLTIDSIKFTGASIVGMWQRGIFLPYPEPDEAITPNSVLMAVGSADQITGIRNLTLGSRREGPLIILGYGDVGRHAAAVLHDGGINPIVVDARDFVDLPFEQIKGDATSEDILLKAGIKKAVGTMILLDDDSETVYATLLVKNLNPDAFVVARANLAKSIEKIYRAGADYVASLPIVASRMLAKVILNEEEDLALLCEDLEMELHEVEKGSHLAGKTLEEIDLPGMFACRAAAIKHEGRPIPGPDNNITIEQGDIIAIIGSPKGIEAFNSAYNDGLAKRLAMKSMQFLSVKL